MLLIAHMDAMPRNQPCIHEEMFGKDKTHTTALGF